MLGDHWWRGHKVTVNQKLLPCHDIIIWSSRISLLYDVIMGAMASQITSFAIVYWAVYSVTCQINHQSSASPDIVRVIHRSPVNSLHKWPVTRKMCPFDDVIMIVRDQPVMLGKWRLRTKSCIRNMMAHKETLKKEPCLVSNYNCHCLCLVAPFTNMV